MNTFQPVIIFSVFSLDRSYGENLKEHENEVYTILPKSLTKLAPMSNSCMRKL